VRYRREPPCRSGVPRKVEFPSGVRGARHLVTAPHLEIVRQAAREAWLAGLAPWPPKEDGSKAPDANTWTQWRTKRPRREELRTVYPGHAGLGIFCGAMSDDPDPAVAALPGFETVDFDCMTTYHAFIEAAEAVGLFGLIERIEDGFCDDTPRPGVRWGYRCTETQSTKLASRPPTDEERAANPDQGPVTLVETKGRGGYAIVAPTNGKVHPTGRPYVRRSGGFSTIATITVDERAALLGLIRSFDQMPAHPVSEPKPTPVNGDRNRPGDDYNARATWGEVLEPHGWSHVYTRRDDVTLWRRPGKRGPGISATTNHAGSDLLCVFSTSTPFETIDAERSYDKFAAYAVLNHGGDFGAAARALGAQGYGQPPVQTVSRPQSDGQPTTDTTDKTTALGTAERDFIALDGRYIFALNGTGIEIEIDRLRRKWDELVGELTVRCTLAGARTINAAGVISVADFAISSLRARQERANHLIARSQAPTIDWFGLLEEFSGRVLAAERTGQPGVILADVPPAEPQPDYDVLGIIVPRHQAGCLFADGGTGKSLVALYLAGTLERRGEHVAYLDYETDEETQRARLARLFDRPLPRVRYVRCDRPLVHEADRLRRIIADDSVTYAIVDSVGYATDGPPEAAEGALGYFRALRQLHVGSLSLAHINRSEQGDQRPFGSVFWSNSFRSVWHLKRTQDTDTGPLTIGCFHRKRNDGRLLPATGIELAEDGSRTSVRRIDLADVDEMATKLPLWQRMAHALRGGPMTIAALAEELEAKVKTIEKAVERSKGRTFARAPGADGVSRIRLVERRAAS
jgi:hypothetical protein